MRLHSVEYFIVDAFTQTPYAGNPAGVVLSDGPLSEAQMLKIAGEIRLETAFVHPLEAGALQICYYTHVRRVPLCGHDTVATGAVLFERGPLKAGRPLVMASDIGPLEISMTAEGAIAMRQSPPVFANPGALAPVLRALGANERSLCGDPTVASTGTPFLFVGFSHPEDIDALAPDMNALTAGIADIPGGAVGVYVWVDDREGPTGSIYARCFAPGAGLPEDPVTGSATGGLAAHLYRSGKLSAEPTGFASFVTTQGVKMGRRGNASATLKTLDGDIESVIVAGHAVIVGQGRLRV